MIKFLWSAKENWTSEATASKNDTVHKRRLYLKSTSSIKISSVVSPIISTNILESISQLTIKTFCKWPGQLFWLRTRTVLIFTFKLEKRVGISWTYWMNWQITWNLSFLKPLRINLWVKNGEQNNSLYWKKLNNRRITT